MAIIKNLLGNIRSFSRDVINVKDFYRINNWTEEQFVEYIENYDLNQEVINLLEKIFEGIKKKIKAPSTKGCFDLQGNFGTGKSHILLFLAVILNKNKYSPKVHEKIEKKLRENQKFYTKYQEIQEILNENAKKDGFEDILIIPIRLAEFRDKQFEKILELAVSRDVLKPLDSTETLISDVKNIYNFFEKGLNITCEAVIDVEELNQIEKIYQQLKSGKNLNITLISNASKRIERAMKECLGRTIPVIEDPLKDICKHKLLGRKYKTILFLFDELTQWWDRSTEDLLKMLQTEVGKLDDLTVDELYNDQNELIKNNNMIAIFAHQKDIWVGPTGSTVSNRFQQNIKITSDYINSIIAKRFFYKDQLKKAEIESIAVKIYDFLIKEKIPKDTINEIYSTNITPEIKKIKDFKEKIVKNIISYYPFHPFLFSAPMKMVFNKFSTEERGILNFVQTCFTQYSSLLEREADELINIDTFFTILNEDRKLFANNEELEEIYRKLDKSRKKKDPNDLVTDHIIKALIFKYLSEIGEPKFSKNEIKGIFMLTEDQYQNIENFVDFCIEKENISDINSDGNIVELTLSKTEPLRLYIQRLKSKIDENNIYQYIQREHSRKPKRINFYPSISDNLRWKKIEFIDYDWELDEIINHIKSKENTISLGGKSKAHHYDVIDLIYYFLPPTDEYLSKTYDIKKALIEKIIGEKINYVICRPTKSILQFNDYETIQENISIYILNWVFDNLYDLKKGNIEINYKNYFINENISVPDYSKIADVILDLTHKNQSIIENLKQQTIVRLNNLKDIRIEKWKENYTCHYQFQNYGSKPYSESDLDDVEDEFESFRYPDAINLDELISGNASDKIWDVILKESDEVVNQSSAKYRYLKIGVDNLNLLRLNRNKFSLESENNIHSSYKKFEEEINKIENKKEILEFCYQFRLNESGLSIYLSILGLFYLYQKGKIKFYDENNQIVNIVSKIKNKVVLGTTNNFITELIKKPGKIGRVEMISKDKWEFIINNLINFKDKGFFIFDSEYIDGTPIDLYNLKMSNSLDRERKLYEILKHHISSKNLIELNTKLSIFLTKIGLEKDISVQNKIGINFLINLFEKLRDSSDMDEIFEYFDKKREKINKLLIYFEKVINFSSQKLSSLENIIDKCKNIEK